MDHGLETKRRLDSVCQFFQIIYLNFVEAMTVSWTSTVEKDQRLF